MKTKLNRHWRYLMEQEYQREQTESLRCLTSKWTQYLTSLAQKRLDEEWGHPDVQSDMILLQRYRCVSKIKGANIRVQNNLDDISGQYYTRTFGIEFSSDIIVPGIGNEYYDIYVSRSDPEWPVLWAMVEDRIAYNDRQRQEYTAFRKLIRSTSSMEKLFSQMP